ncbi:class I SAM-dependent methyltransferase [Brasilonema sp. UFV-L1]|uniref:O-methyltransferase n=1 Tax=Brasilonema sp. UFV-L1 TaxID=2234130 RepID=UPI00145C8164|nr:class I SAM-dependent methyltransferase [Brasilonema sp. UFV-L1]NMG09560.1 methyltransferase [Brasilonema sp. UFV-L1]
MNSVTTNSTLLLPEVQAVLERLHTLADTNDATMIQQVMESGSDWKSSSSEQKSGMFREALLPISRDIGRFLYGVARSISAKHIVEFGTSYGVSTIYFAAAMRDNGGGLVVGSELENSKVAKANQNLAEAGLSQFVEIRAGDALQTLRYNNTIDLLFLDGWKDIYLDVLHLVLGNLRQGSVIVADDVELFRDDLAPYLDYIRNPAHSFVSVRLPLEDGIEYSVKL